MTSLATRQLTRRFGAVTAIDRLSIDLPAGGVIGLLGPNGSGKSTLIRTLLGLIQATDGSASILGSDLADPAAFAPRVGALIESPSFVPSLSARRNLLSLARLRGIESARIDEVLGTVGLHGRDREPVRNFSLGMKQRLGIAAALLPDPDLLVLDEPTNGLDPAGIVEIRGLLRDLAAEGRTVIVSSHILSEIEAACDFLVIIRSGQLVFAGPIDHLLDQADEWIIAAPENVGDAVALAHTLSAKGWPSEASADGVVRVAATAASSAAINRAAAGDGITLAGLTAERQPLEEIFLSMTGEDL
jgi:ABC-2 type transport system ATP-binding protein